MEVTIRLVYDGLQILLLSYLYLLMSIKQCLTQLLGFQKCHILDHPNVIVLKLPKFNFNLIKLKTYKFLYRRPKSSI